MEGGVVRIEGGVVKKCKSVVKTLKTVVKNSACSCATNPVVNSIEYDALPFPTAGIAKVSAGATLRGPVTSEDFD
jgi:hypothetical protein